MADKNDLEPLQQFFHETLSDAGREAAPVHLRFVFTQPVDDNPPASIARSSFYRTDGFYCLKFFKPISKTLSDEKS